MDKFKERVAKNFSEKAQNYSNLAVTQKLIAASLLEFSKGHIQRSDKILDLGCGPGTLGNIMKGYDLTQLDIAEGMCVLAAKNGYKTIIADMENIPMPDNSFDIVLSSMTLQWANDISEAIKEIKRVLKSGGKACFSLLLDDSFSEFKKNTSLAKSFNKYF